MRRLSSPCFALWSVAAAACSLSSVQAFTAGQGNFLSSRPQQNQHQYQHTTTDTASSPSSLSVAATAADKSAAVASAGTDSGTASAEQGADLVTSSLTWDVISKLRFRELHRELNSRHLETTGTTSQLRDRLRQAALPGSENECIVNEDGIEDDCEPVVSIVSKQ